MIWFMADPHFGHRNIIEYTGRPFADVRQMDYTIIRNWNSKVGVHDDAYILGDFCLGDWHIAKEYASRMNGCITVVTSSTHHDRQWVSSGKICDDKRTLFQVHPSQIVVLKLPKRMKEMPDALLPKKIVLSHWPIAVWEDKHHGSWHLHGHVHGDWTPGVLSMNVAVENIGYSPVSLVDVAVRMAVNSSGVSVGEL